MTDPAAGAPDLRRRLRRHGDALARASIGTVPILWNNVDLTDLAPETAALTVLDEIARTGYEGTQEGRAFPTGPALRDALAGRGLRLAEVYAALPVTQDGPTDGALEVGRQRLAVLLDGDGDVLVGALDGTPERSRVSGRATDPDVPRLTDAGWQRLAAVVDRLAAETVAAGKRFAWHPHTGTYVETPDELERLAAATDPSTVGICLDVGHWIVGGGDPVDALDRYGARVTHLHLKDVDPDVVAAMRTGEVPDFDAALRRRVFTELGAGCLDLSGVLHVLADRDFDGWLMVEQDTCWGPPSESAAIGRRVLANEIRRLGCGAAGG